MSKRTVQRLTNARIMLQLHQDGLIPDVYSIEFPFTWPLSTPELGTLLASVKSVIPKCFYYFFARHFELRWEEREFMLFDWMSISRRRRVVGSCWKGKYLAIIYSTCTFTIFHVGYEKFALKSLQERRTYEKLLTRQMSESWEAKMGINGVK